MKLFDTLDFLKRKLKEYNLKFDWEDLDDGGKLVSFHCKDNVMKMKLDPNDRFDRIKIDWKKIEDPDIDNMAKEIRSIFTGEITEIEGVCSQTGAYSLFGGIVLAVVFYENKTFIKIQDGISSIEDFVNGFNMTKDSPLKLKAMMLEKNIPQCHIPVDEYINKLVDRFVMTYHHDKYDATAYVLDLSAYDWNRINEEIRSYESNWYSGDLIDYLSDAMLMYYNNNAINVGCEVGSDISTFESASNDVVERLFDIQLMDISKSISNRSDKKCTIIRKDSISEEKEYQNKIYEKFKDKFTSDEWTYYIKSDFDK